MSKQKVKVSFISFCQKFLRDQLSLRVGGGSLILLILCYFVFFQKESLRIFPANKNSTVDFYNDQADGGQSALAELVQNDTCIGMSFILKKGFIGPYAGMGINTENNRELDISAYNRVHIQASGQGIHHIFLYLITKDKNVQETAKRVPFRHSCQNIDVVPARKTFDLPIRDFKTPDWWYDAIQQSPDKFDEPEWNRLVRIAVVSGFNPVLDQKQSIRVYSISFERDNTLVVAALVLIQLAVISLMMMIYFIKTKPRQQPTPITINYKAVTVEEKQGTSYRFLDYIHEHFSDADLSLMQVSKQTGVNQRSIADTIAEKFGCNFKTYINQIRINESKRLLKESGLNISEIAYKVGFSSPSSFNRVFKNLTGKTPSDFMQSID